MVSRLVADVESRMMLPPLIFADLPMVCLGAVAELTPSRLMLAAVSALTRKSVPFPLPATVESPSTRLATPEAKVPVAETCAPSATVID